MLYSSSPALLKKELSVIWEDGIWEHSKSVVEIQQRTRYSSGKNKISKGNGRKDPCCQESKLNFPTFQKHVQLLLSICELSK